MHVTVQNLDGLALPHGELVGALVAAHPPFRLTLRGLGVAPGAVFALALSDDGTLRSLRAGLGRLPAGRRRVRTDRLLSPAGTTTLARTRLAGRPG